MFGFLKILYMCVVWCVQCDMEQSTFFLLYGHNILRSYYFMGLSSLLSYLQKQLITCSNFCCSQQILLNFQENDSWHRIRFGFIWEIVAILVSKQKVWVFLFFLRCPNSEIFSNLEGINNFDFLSNFDVVFFPLN